MLTKLLKKVFFWDKEYISRIEAFEQIDRKQAPWYVNWVTPFNFVLFSFNAIFFLMIALVNASGVLKINLSGFVIFVMFVFGILAFTLFSAITHMILESFVFNKINMFKHTGDGEEEFHLMCFKLLIATFITFTFFLLKNL